MFVINIVNSYDITNKIINYMINIKITTYK